jgi:3-oxoacyl-[acyl-carrier-protein] synthase-3
VLTALEAVASYLPATGVSVEEAAASLGLPRAQARVLTRFQGLRRVGRDPGASVLDLLLKAVAGLEALRGREDKVRYVLHARAFPVVVPYPVNPVHELCARLGLAHANAFTVTHHSCASGLFAIALADRLLAAEPRADARALILAGEKAFTRDARLLPGTSMFGEGASACLLRRGGDRDRLLAHATVQRGDLDVDLAPPAALVQRQHDAALADVVLAAVARAELNLDAISLILPHNVNLTTWQRFCRRTGFPIERVLLDNVPVTGHVFCADAFVNYQTARRQGRLRPGDHYVAAAIGTGRGATFSAMVFTH